MPNSPKDNPSSLLDNRENGSVADFLTENIEADSELSIVSAYFTIYAYERLKQKLDSVKSVRFLFGEPSFLRNLDPEKNESKSFKIEKDDTITLVNVLKQKETAKNCYDWFKEKVAIKSMIKPDFLHGKMYYIQPKDKGAAKAVTGSSNFTVSGLGLKQKSNLELNMIVNDNRDIKALKNWFDTIWENGVEDVKIEDVKEDVLKYLEEIYTDKSPEYIYFKTLYHIFSQKLKGSEEIESISEKIGLKQTKIWEKLYHFQSEGVKLAIDKIRVYNGCIIADSVGLGKTFEALAVIKYFELQNNRVMVLCPKKLEQNWLIYTQNDDRNILKDDRFSYDVFAHTDLTRTQGTNSQGMELNNVNWGNYGLVVIDESHNFRNTGKSTEKRISRYGKLMKEIIKTGIKTKVLLLSATPVNTTLKDLRNQLYFITEGQDNAFKDNLGIPHIGNLLKEAQRNFTAWADPTINTNQKSSQLFDVLGVDFFTLLSELTIARSRQQIKSNYEDTESISFPERLLNMNQSPEIDIQNLFPTFAAINQKISEYNLVLFNPSRYVYNEFREKYNLPTDEEKQAKKEEKKQNNTNKKGNQDNFNQADREKYLIGMMKVGFLKRLESSIFAFTKTLTSTIDKIKKLEDKIKIFQINKEKEVEIEQNDLPDSLNENNEDEEISEFNELVGKKLHYNLKHIDVDQWLIDLNTDKEKLEAVSETAKPITPKRDKKLSILKEAIQNKIKNPINKGNKKILIFTAYADTALYLYENIADWAKKELNMYSALVTGSRQNQTNIQSSQNISTLFNDLLINFSPISKNRNLMKNMPQDVEIDILIATDCISEGQNLQDCDFVINYDIHWNPVRLIQRFGRIDRLGSKNKQIQMLNFWPTADLDIYLNLEIRVKARMALVDVIATADDNILDTKAIEEAETQEKNELNYRAEQLKKLKERPLDLEEVDNGINFNEFSMDEFFEELKSFLKDDSFKNSANGLYSIVPSPAGEYKNLIPNFEKLANKDIKNGVIFCFLQKENAEKTQHLNPLKNIFLIWINADGEIKHTYTEPKKILTLFRQIASPHKNPIPELCNVFNEDTKNGTDMNLYDRLILSAMQAIRGKATETNQQNLFGINKKVVAEQEIGNEKHFELLTWLVIR